MSQFDALLDGGAAPSPPPPSQFDSLMDAHALGQQAAQGAGVKPIAPTPPVKLPISAPQTTEPELNATPNVNAAESALRNSNRGAIPINFDNARQADTEAAAAKTTALQNAAGATVDTSKGLPGFGPNFETAYILHDPVARAKYLQSKGLDAKVVDTPETGPMTLWRDPNIVGDSYHPIIGAGSVAGSAGRGVAASINPLAQTVMALMSDGASIPMMAMRAALLGAGTQTGTNEVGKAQGYSNISPSAEAWDAAKAGATEGAPMMALPLGLKILTSTPGGAAAVAKFLGSTIRDIAGTPGRYIADKLAPLIADQSGAAGETMNTTPGSTLGDLFKKYLTTQSTAPVKGPESAKALMSAATAENLPSPTIGQLESAGGSGGGLLAARQQQVLSTNPGLREKLLTPQSDALYNRTIAARNAATGTEEAPALDDNTIAGMLAKYTAEAAQGVPNPNVTPQQVGDTLGLDLREGFKPKIVGNTSGMYGNVVDASQDLGANAQPLKDTAEGMKTGLTVRAIPDEAGAEGWHPIGERPTGVAAKVISDLDKTHPEMVTNPEGRTPYEQLQSWRTQLGQAAGAYPATGSVADRAEFHQARQLLGPLDEVMANPIAKTGGVSDKFNEALDAAKAAKIDEHQTLDHPDVQAVMNATNPEDVQTILNSGDFSRIQRLKQISSPEAWQTVKDGFLTQLRDDPGGIDAALKKYQGSNSRTLNLLADPADIEALRGFQKNMQNINASDLAKLTEQTNIAKRLPSLVKSDPNAILRLDPDSGRAAVMQYILDESKTPIGNRFTVDPGRFSKAMDNILGKDEQGNFTGPLAKLFSPKELQSMANQSVYGRGVDMAGIDSGTSLMKASMAKNLAEWIHPYKWMKALPEPIFNAIQARTLTSRTASNLMYGGGLASSPNLTARSAAVITGAALNDMRNQEPTVGR